MTYVPDGEPVIGAAGPASEAQTRLVAVGWLDPEFPYTRGDVPPEFVKALRALCRDGVNVTRGWHRCRFCPRPDAGTPSGGTVVPSAEGAFKVGHAEIRIDGPGGIRFAAPDMVVHTSRTTDTRLQRRSSSP